MSILHILKRNKTVLIIVWVALLMIVLAGCSSGNNQGKTGKGPESTTKATTSRQTAGDGLFVDVLSVTSPVSPGGTPVTVFAKTQPNAMCEITVGYEVGQNEKKALLPKQAESNGLVSWTWTVSPSVPFGKYPITVTTKVPKGGSATGESIIEIKSAEECKK